MLWKKNKLLVSFIFSIIIKMLGGWDIWLMALITVMILDILTGLIKAILMRSNKSEKWWIKFSQYVRGGIKKVFILLMVALGTVLDIIISPDDVFIRIMVVSYYIANESLSILENVGACGVPLPKVLYKILDSLKTNNME